MMHSVLKIAIREGLDLVAIRVHIEQCSVCQKKYHEILDHAITVLNGYAKEVSI